MTDWTITTDRAVFSFTLPSNGQRWHWPVEGNDGIEAFRELLDRADIPWTARADGRLRADRRADQPREALRETT